LIKAIRTWLFHSFLTDQTQVRSPNKSLKFAGVGTQDLDRRRVEETKASNIGEALQKGEKIPYHLLSAKRRPGWGKKGKRGRSPAQRKQRGDPPPLLTG